MIKEFRGAYRFLSNFFLCQVMFEGHQYDSVEHAYQASKFLDDRLRAGFRSDIKCGEAKSLAHNLEDQGHKRPDWMQVNLGIMEGLLKQKFSKPALRQMLLDTGDQELVEGNWWHDNYWGQCFCAKCSVQGAKTQNQLGKLLMKVRGELQASDRASSEGSTAEQTEAANPTHKEGTTHV